ncbi:Dyp-type peroxidase [Corynebacterium flavescens]|uniref:Dyp-type peroxidase n=1 Tax=Corynebacterium flavescens TaxID=28028 RepID=UPI000EEF3770|nr:peroxidase [Corynebacterium flavescens]
MDKVGPSTSVQAVAAPLTRSACFLVVTVRPDGIDTVREVLSGLEDLVKTVSFRDAQSKLSCIVGIGSDVWPALTLLPRPKELHPFKEFHGEAHSAISTPGDLLFHIRAERPDICFEFEKLLLEALDGSVDTVDEVTGFRYFDARDLLGFVDGTANPVGPALPAAALVGEEDPQFSGGSYVVVQKYLHPMEKWDALSTEDQEAIIGRRKADNVELADATEGQKSHKTLNTITQDGQELEIVRDNMPFGTPGKGEFGTYFIGYSRRLWVIEKMLERMFIGDPPGFHDRILDFSKPETGITFFAPSLELLSSLGEADESLGIGNNQKGK